MTTFAAFYAEELRATLRSRFGLLGAAGLLGFALFGITVPAMGDDDGYAGFLFVACSVMPAVFGVLAALPLPADRASRFTESLFTSPLGRGAYLATRVAVPLTIGLLYLAALVPLHAVVALHVGLPGDVLPSMAAGALLVAAVVPLGVLCGVLAAERGTAAAVGASGALMTLSVGALVLMPAALGGMSDASTARLIVGLSHLSPSVLSREAVGLPVVTHAHDGAMAPALALAALALGALAAAAWAYLREQDVQGWRGPASGRALVAVALAVLAAMPPALAGEADAHDPVPRESLRFLQQNATALLVDPGESPRAEAWLPFGRGDALPFGEATRRDLVVLLHVPPDAEVRDVRVRASSPGLRIEAASLERPGAAPPDGTAAFLRGPPVPGHEGGERGPYYRFPVTLTPESAGWLASIRHVVDVEVELTVDGEPRTAAAVAFVESEVQGAHVQLVLAGAPLPIALAAAHVARRARTS